MPVQFARGVETLVELGAQVFLEIGPDRVLSQLVAADHGARVRALSSVVRERDAEESLLRAVGTLYELGFNLDFTPLRHAAHPNRVSLPARHLSHKRYWTASAVDLAAAVPSAAPIADIVPAARASNGHVPAAEHPPRERAPVPDEGARDVPDSTVHAVIDQQINVMKQQLALLGDL
jgi:acyl transferase domain-containing protein